MADNCFHSSIEGAQHGAKSLEKFLDYARKSGAAGADFLLSLTEHTLDIAAETKAVPVLIPATHGDMESLLRAADLAEKRGIKAILDPVIDPIHFGFMASFFPMRCERISFLPAWVSKYHAPDLLSSGIGIGKPSVPT